MILDSGLSVVVPAYNSEGSLRPLLERLWQVLEAAGRPFEVILVNDGSRDRTFEVIEELAAADPRVRGFDLMRNFGQHNALLCGIRAARYDTCVTIDDDLQHPPEEIPTLLAALRPDVDVVYGRPQREQHGLARDLASQATKLALRHAMGAAVAAHVGAFRALRTHLRQGFERYEAPWVSIDVLLTWSTTRFAVVSVRLDRRRVGRSNYTWGRLVTHAMNMLTGFSTLPLQFASLLGFALTFFGLATLAYVLGRYALLGTSVPGFPFLASAIAIFSGAQLFALGIMGEYLARIYTRTMNRPSYTVSSRTPSE